MLNIGSSQNSKRIYFQLITHITTNNKLQNKIRTQSSAEVMDRGEAGAQKEQRDTDMWKSTGSGRKRSNGHVESEEGTNEQSQRTLSGRGELRDLSILAYSVGKIKYISNPLNSKIER